MRHGALLLVGLLLWAGAALAQQPAGGPQVLPAISAPTVPAPPVPVQAEKLTTFDYRAADVHWIDGRWQLHAGGVLIKDFGHREQDAREALRILRNLRLTQHGTIGTPRPIMEYWLASGQAPHG